MIPAVLCSFLFSVPVGHCKINTTTCYSCTVSLHYNTALQLSGSFAVSMLAGKSFSLVEKKIMKLEAVLLPEVYCIFFIGADNLCSLNSDHQ
jgi:hypothetical protein